MDPPPAGESRRRGPDRGGKARGGKQLGLKRPAAPAPSVPVPPPLPSPSAPVPPPSPAPSAPVPPPPQPISSHGASNPSTGAAISSPGAAISPPAAPTSNMPSWPLQAGGWGAMPSNFAFCHGDQQGTNPWLYPPGGFFNLIQQNHLPQPQQQGENFHLVGQSMSFNPVSPRPPSVYATPTPQATKQGTSVYIDIDESKNIDANGAAKVNNKRYWTHEEEERLANAWLNASKDPIHGNDKKGDSFWKEVTDAFNEKGEGKRRREINQLKIHWSRLKSVIGDFNDYWTTINQMHTSGYSDDMLEKEAQQMMKARTKADDYLILHY